MDRRYMVKQYVAVVRSRSGQRFMVFRTGDEKFYLFDPLDRDGCSTCMAFPIERARLRDDLRRALANGWGNAGLNGEESDEMPKKQDPIISVLRYFESAELPLAEQGLTLAKEIVRNRRPKPEAAKPRRKRQSTVPAQPSTANTAAAAPPPLAPVGQRPLPPKKPAIKPEEDRPLPGIVSQVGG